VHAGLAMAALEGSARTTPIAVRAGGASWTGELTIPASPLGLVVIAEAPRAGVEAAPREEEAVALVHAGFAALQLDLRAAPRDVAALADHLEGALAWLADHEELRALPIGLLGEGIGAAAALVVAARTPAIAAIVSCSGRPDLAYDVLRKILCPTLWIVGGADTELLDLHHRALRRISANAKLHVVPGAGPDDALRLAAGWFRQHLARPMHHVGAWTGFTTDAKQGSSSRER